MTDYSIYKFGGSSVKDAKAFLRSARLAVGCKDLGICVVSATYNTTNRLELIHRALYEEEGVERARELMNALQQHHESILVELCTELKIDSTSEMAGLREFTHPSFRELVRDDCDPLCSLDRLYAYGELTSSYLMTRLLHHLDPSRVYTWFDVKEVMVTDSAFTKASPISREMIKFKKRLTDPLEERQVLVTQGFIARSMSGEWTTLGREGSDYSATLLADLIDAKEVTIWTDVPGVLSYDPKLCSKAVVIKELTYDQAETLASAGAKVLFPRTLRPVREKNIPVYVRSSYEAHLAGTLISTRPLKGLAMALTCHDEYEGIMKLTLLYQGQDRLSQALLPYDECIERSDIEGGALIMIPANIAQEIIERLHCDLLN